MKTRRHLLRTSALAGALSLAMTAGAMAAESQTYAFDMPAQPLGDALREFARASGEAIVFREELAAGRKAPALRGDFTAEQALDVLLTDAGLKVQRTATGVYMVQDPQGGSAAAGNAVQALIVTAQKREEDIQDVPIAISAFSQEDLTRSQVAGGPDLITQVPNMTFTKTNFSSYSVQLRGIGTQAISATTDPAVAVAFNNTPFIRNRFFEQEFYDLERVEVLRGPQGTLYGRNATAGVVNLISAKPKFYYEAKASGDIGNYSSSRIEAMVNVPLVEDAVALRVAGAWTKRDGYATNELSGSPIDGRDLWSTRVSLRVSPNDRIDANLIWEHFEEDDDRLRSGKQLCKKHVVTKVGDLDFTGNYFAPIPDRGGPGGISTIQSVFSQGCERESLYSPASFQTPNGQSIPYYFQLGGINLPRALEDPYVSEVQSRDLRAIESTIDPDYRASADIGELQINLDLTDTLSLSSETAYGVDTVYSLQDFNRFNTAPGAWSTTTPPGQEAVSRGVLTQGPNGGIFCDPQLGCSDRLVAVDISTAKARQFSQELRLASDFDGPFNFSIGANYLRADSEDKYYVFINSLSLVAASNGNNNYVQGQTDNSNCLNDGYRPGDPSGVYAVTGCVYMDPNPIGSVNDQGHNYFLSKNPYKLISYALFGEAYYELTESLKVTAGLRWTVDKKEAPRIPTWILAGQSYGYPVAEVIEQEWREPTGRMTIDWKPDLSFTDQTLVYASYARGYKAGGANPPGFVRVFYSNPDVAAENASNSATRPLTFAPEFVDAFEVGSKNTLAGGLATLNLAAFYYDYEGYQVSEIVDRSAFNQNFDATVWGVELEADWRPLENLKLGLKGGYQNTRIADGEKAIDLMDRTAGVPGWSVVRPFPTYASSCILPTELFLPPGGGNAGSGSGPSPIIGLGALGGGNPGGCEYAYIFGYDPGTEAPFGDPPGSAGTGGSALDVWINPSLYPGFDPTTAPNNGEGFDKPLGGNALPNAPNWTATITADYTIPLPNDWLATLHTDLHWQAESWWRVFNDHEYNKLDEYFTMNLAAIFTNEEAGWNIMAYVKNVTDETAITGAFLNSDDTGLTTNVFLTEPRLYGIRVTKAWDGGPLLGSFGERSEGPYPLTLELGGQISRLDAPNGELRSAHSGAFSGPLDIFGSAQEAELDWGDGRELKLTYRPVGGSWMVSAALRSQETNAVNKPFAEQETTPVCGLGDFLAAYCGLPADQLPPPLTTTMLSRVNRADTLIQDREDYRIADLLLQRDAPFGGLNRSMFGLGFRHAILDSTTNAGLRGIPDWNIPEGVYPSLSATNTLYTIEVDADRGFEGAGPMASWDAAVSLSDLGDAGRLELDWTVEGGILFGEQQVAITERERSVHSSTDGLGMLVALLGVERTRTITEYPAVSTQRAQDATVPVVGGRLGLSYVIDRVSIGAGYRWERYFDAIDGGYATGQGADRTIDGPYFKLAIGFGG